jgi:glycosyltransferase involved in cell wall biosynthesis
VRDVLLPTPRALLRLSDLGDLVALTGDARTDVLAAAPLLGWLLDALRPVRATATPGPAAALLGRLAEDRTAVAELDSQVPESDLVVVDLAAAPSGSITAFVDAVRDGHVAVLLVIGDGAGGTLVPDSSGVARVTLTHAGGMSLIGPASAGPVVDIAALPPDELDTWRRLHARLAAALVAEYALDSAKAALEQVGDSGAALRRELGRAEEDAARARDEVERLRVRLAATEGLRGELVHAYDRLDRVLASASWRMTAPVRAVLRAFPPVRRLLRATLRLVVQVLSPRAWRERRGRRERYGHADTAVALSEVGAAVSTRGLRREKQSGHVGWVASVGDPFTTRYRVSNLSTALRSHGVTSTVVSSDGFDAALLEACETVVLCRVAWDDDVAAQVARLRESGTRIVFDVDDLVFDPSRVELTAPGPNRLAPRRHLFGRYRTSLLEADAVTVSTAPLRNEVVALGRPVAVVPNNLGIDLLERWGGPAPASAREAARRDDPAGDRTVRIAYLSGTATHVQDVREMAPALADVMRTHHDVELHVVGPVELPVELAGLRIVRHPLQRYHDLFTLIAGMDINLAPLELENDFTDGKSELKAFEAALLGVPTVASPTRPYASAIEHGRTGMLAATAEDWRDALGTLVTDHEFRRAVGSAARSAIVPRFAVPNVAAVSARVLASIARSSALETLAGDLGSVRGDLGLLLPSDADWDALRDAVIGLALDPGAGRCVLLVPQGDGNIPLLRDLLASLAHGARGGGLPRLTVLSAPGSAAPAARAAAVLSESRCSAVAVLPPGAVLAVGAVTSALGALERFHAPIVTGIRVDDAGALPQLRRLGLDADLAARPETMVVADPSALVGVAGFLPVLDRDWTAERPSVLAALVAGEDVGRVLAGVVAAGASVTVTPGLRGSVRTSVAGR